MLPALAINHNIKYTFFIIFYYCELQVENFYLRYIFRLLAILIGP